MPNQQKRPGPLMINRPMQINLPKRMKQKRTAQRRTKLDSISVNETCRIFIYALSAICSEGIIDSTAESPD